MTNIIIKNNSSLTGQKTSTNLKFSDWAILKTTLALCDEFKVTNSSDRLNYCYLALTNKFDELSLIRKMDGECHLNYDVEPFLGKELENFTNKILQTNKEEFTRINTIIYEVNEKSDYQFFIYNDEKE